jgi:Fic family protein
MGYSRDMERARQGSVQRHASAGESFDAFIPYPLPPTPELVLGSKLRRELSHADQMLGRLDGLSTLIRHPEMLITFYIRKEAVLSSQIEGTQSTLTELLLFEIEPESGSEDTAEVANYVRAMRHGLSRLSSGFPLSLRLIREMHEVLLSSGRGSRSTPGEFRTSQNWIGGSRPGNALYVPPPVHQMHDSLSDFERFMHDGAEEFPVLVQCALLHVQFESIHPFLDGNGRLGRLLITLLLVDRCVLAQPLLYMSLYLKKNRSEYYDLLQRVRYQGEWEEWISFFLRGAASTAEKAVALAKNLLALFERDEQRLKETGARRGSALQVLSQLRETPYTSPRRLAERTGLSFNTVVSALEILKGLGIVGEAMGHRGRLFLYTEYILMMDEGAVAG